MSGLDELEKTGSVKRPGSRGDSVSTRTVRRNEDSLMRLQCAVTNERLAHSLFGS